MAPRASPTLDQTAPPPREPIRTADGTIILPSFMRRTNGGGSLEAVSGFGARRAIADRFDSVRLPVPPDHLAEAPRGMVHSAAPAAWLGAAPMAVGSVLPVVMHTPPFGTGLETVIGADDRVMVPDTAGIPWRCICHLEITFENGRRGYGTGWLAGPHTVITAAHCLWDPLAKLQAVEIRVTPGRNAGIGPYGQFTCEDYAVIEGWPNRSVAGRDIAAISLRSHAEGIFAAGVGTRLGYFGIANFPDHRLDMLLVNTSGYPVEASKPFATQWFNGGRIRGVGVEHVTYMIDTEGGQSGSPVFFYDADTDERLVVAVHTTGHYPNRGVRITETIFDVLHEWIRNPPNGRPPKRAPRRQQRPAP